MKTSIVVLAIIAVLAWGMALALRSSDRQLPELSYLPQPIIGEAERSWYTVSASGPVELEWASQQGIASPTSGVVGWLPDLGSTIEDSDPVAVIDGIERRLAVTSEPFWRALTTGSEGRDVAMLADLLSTWGYDVPSGTTRIDGRFLREIRRYAEDIGYDSRSTRSMSGFEPAWLAWSDGTPFTVHHHAATIGERVQQGSTILQAGQQVTGVSATAMNISGDAQGDPPYTIESVDSMSDGPWQVTVRAGTLAEHSGASKTIAEGIAIGVTNLPVSPEDDVAWSATLADPHERVIVPISALVGSSAGYCVLDPAGRPTSVLVLGASLTTVAVEGIDVGTPLLLNPTQIDLGRSNLCEDA